MTDPTSSLRQFESWLHRRLRLRADEPGGGPSLSLTHLAGTRSSRYGPLLVDYLNEVDDTDPCGWFLFDEAILQAITAQDLLPARGPGASQAGPLEAIGRTLRELAALGRCVFVCSCSAWLVRCVPGVFTAFVTGSLNRRIASIADRHGLSVDEARAFVRARDEACRRIVRRSFGVRLDDPSQYHLVLNTDDIPDPVAVCLIADSMLEWAARAPGGTPEGGRNPRFASQTSRSAK